MKTNVYNIIILDQSGSMDYIKKQAICGFNETIQSVKATQKLYKEQNHLITLVVFNSAEIRVVCDRASCSNVAELNNKTYRPDCATPLYDAVGQTLAGFEFKMEEGADNKVLVTIITDGMENSSKEYSGEMIRKMVEAFKEKGWVFTYIGANQDVESMSKSMGIENHLLFESSVQGTTQMFKKYKESRSRWCARVAESNEDDDLGMNFF